MTTPDAPIAERLPSNAADRLRRSALAVTAIHVVLTAVSLIGSGTVRGIVAIVFVIMFFLGSVVFVAAFVMAANRSRTEDVSVAGVFFLSDGAVATTDRRLFLGCVGVQTVVSLAAATAALFTAVAFSLLVPLLGLGLAALFGARTAVFPPKPPDQRD